MRDRVNAKPARRRSWAALAALVVIAQALAGCRCGSSREGSRATRGTAAAPGAPAASGAAPAKAPEPLTLQGSAVALTPDGSRVVVAGEDHDALFVLPAALDQLADARVVPLPGPPAQVVALHERLLVTVRTLPAEAARSAREEIRGPTPAASAVALRSPPEPRDADPQKSTKKALERPRNTPPKIYDPARVRQSQGGLLLVLAPDAAAGFEEVGRVVVAPDAWGLAVTPDQRHALVTSAWPAEIALVDLHAQKVLARKPTAREPRGIAITRDGKRAYVSHLVGSALTRVELGSGTLSLGTVELPPSPSRTPPGAKLAASLGYSLVLSPDDATLFVPRHALGAEGAGSWWGAPVVDVLDTTTEKPVAPAKLARSPHDHIRLELSQPDWLPSAGQAPAPERLLVQPRAVVYRRKSDTLLVASEGADAVVELDALAADPAMAVAGGRVLAPAYDPFGGFPDQGGAPSGIALDREENYAYVYCRTTFDLVRVELDGTEKRTVTLAQDALPADAAYGRRLYANASNSVISGGLGCAGCHPEGRDDGYVWRETAFAGDHERARFIALRQNLKLGTHWDPNPEPPRLHARQTPMLAGRMRARGPFGWRAEAADIVERLIAGFRLHRATWEFSQVSRDTGEHISKIDYLADYLRSGLLPPPTLVKPLDELEQKGKAIFESPEALCSACHKPDTEFTDRMGTSLPRLPTRPGFDREENRVFKTPSLWFVSGTAPYFHDGSTETLEALVEKNDDRMGKTNHLDPEGKRALVAYLKTL